MTFFFIGVFSYMAYTYGLIKGEEQQEKDAQERKSFWEEVKRRGV